MEKREWTLEKRQLLNTVHDLRTPLTSVKGYLELIRSGYIECDTPEYWNFIGVIEKCVGQVETLTTDLLDSHKLERRAMKLNLEEIPLDAFIDEAKAEIHPILTSRNQKLVIESTFNGQGIEADKYKLNQVVMNLLNNASKYSPCESIIELHVDRVGQHIMFSVKDQGIGLNAEDISKLFEPFPDIEIDGKYERTGLGLSIAKGIIELHNGEIHAESRGPGQGSLFWFRIPVKN
jgi:cell cycle sensor histidine kinase DivJ